MADRKHNTTTGEVRGKGIARAGCGGQYVLYGKVRFWTERKEDDEGPGAEEETERQWEANGKIQQ